MLALLLAAPDAWADTPLDGLARPIGDDAPDTADDDNQEITVTARRRDENVQDVPLSVTAIGSAVIKTERLNRIQDFSQKIANFNPRTSNPRTSALSIRGAGGLAGAGDGSEGGVGLIVDNVFYTHIGFTWGPLYDLAAVEVARGPQGTLLGKNTTIGAVIVRSNAPRFEAENEVELAGGNYGALIGRAYSTGTIIPETLAYRVSFYGEKNNGFYPNEWPPLADNKRDDIRHKDTNRWAVRGQLLANLGPDISTRVIADYHESAEFNNYSGIVESPFTRRANGDPVETYAQKIARLFGVSNIDYDPYTGELTNPSRMTQNTRGVSNELSWKLGGHTLTSITGYREFRLYPRNSQGNNGLRNYSLGYDIVARQFSQELRLASAPSPVLDYQVGGYFLRDTRRSNNRIIWGPQGTQFYNNNAASNPAVLDGVEYDQLGIARTSSIAAFGQATLHAFPGVDLTGGIRYTHEKRAGSNTATSFGGANNLSQSDQALRERLLINQFGGYFDIGGRKSFNSVSWLINPSFKLSDDILIYGSTARGVKSGAINTVAKPIRVNNAVVGAQAIIVAPEVSRDWEIGIKTAWFDKTLTLNLNLYWNDLYDYQGNIIDTTSYRDAQGNPVPQTYLGNIDHVRLKGIEVEAGWRPSRHLSFTLAGAVSDVRYVKFANAGPPADLTYSGAPTTIDLSGDRIEGIPPWTVNAGVRYDAPIGRFQGHPVSGFAFVNQAVTAKTDFLPSVSVYDLHQKTYGITNLNVGFRRDDDSFNLTFWARNLFDVKYTTDKTLGSTNAAATWTLGDPRTYGVSAAVRF